MYDILCLSSTDWDEIWGSRQQLMLRLAAAGHRVLFVERQVGPEHLARDPHLRQRKRRLWQAPALRCQQENLWLWQPPLLPPGRYYSLTLNRLGQGRLAARLRPVLQELGFAAPLLWLYPPHSAPLLGQLGERLSIYHCIERFTGGQAGRKRQVMLAQETDLLRRAGLVFTHAAGLQRLYAGLTRRPIVLVPSAADIAHYQSTTDVHPDIAALPAPRLLVMGTLDARIDRDLLHAIAAARPDWQLVLVGHVRSERVDFSALFRLPNVHHLGQRPFAELPALLNGAQAGLLPYRRNELTEYISPLKVYEYLAGGLPIASADLPEVRPLAGWVALVPDHPGQPAAFARAFIAAIEHELRTDTPARRAGRRQAAWQHSWDARLQVMLAAITDAFARALPGGPDEGPR